MTTKKITDKPKTKKRVSLFNKWFCWELVYNGYKSKTPATTLKEAWEKTLAKWGKKGAGKEFLMMVSTCGLCNLYNAPMGCGKCPVRTITGVHHCRGFKAFNQLVDVRYDDSEGIEAARKEGLRELKEIKVKSEEKK